eukprot:1913660-Lingulodinium_polyedra.AAC.1
MSACSPAPASVRRPPAPRASSAMSPGRSCSAQSGESWPGTAPGQISAAASFSMFGGMGPSSGVRSAISAL